MIMKSVRVILLAGMASISFAILAQNKGEMPFTSSSAEAKKLMRSAWAAYADAKFDEGGKYVSQALEKDPQFGMAYAFNHLENTQEHEENLKKAAACQLSSDEKLLIEGLLRSRSNQSVEEYFDPLVTKYPKDYYLNLLVMLNHTNPKRRTEIGEMIIKRNSKFAPAYNLLGYAYMAQEDFQSAERNFTKYVALRPELANAHDSKGDYFMRVGKVEEAVAAYQRAAQLGMPSAKGRADVAKAKLKYQRLSDKDMQDIRTLVSNVSSAYLKRDADGVMQHYAGQALEFFPSQMINAGHANIRTRIGQVLQAGTYTTMDRKIEFIEGLGPIAIAWGTTKTAFKSNANGETYENQQEDMFVFRKQHDGQWKILTHHWVMTNQTANSETPDNNSAIRKVIDKWNYFIKPGEILSQKHVDTLAAIYSQHAVEITPDQRSFIGMANLRLRWGGFVGIKWAQFTQVPFPVNSFATVGPDASARKAIVWGIGDHSNSWNASDEVAQYLFPYVMILTNEKDGQWRVLVYHFYLE